MKEELDKRGNDTGIGWLGGEGIREEWDKDKEIKWRSKQRGDDMKGWSRERNGLERREVRAEWDRTQEDDEEENEEEGKEEWERRDGEDGEDGGGRVRRNMDVELIA